MTSFKDAYTAIVTPFTADGSAVDLERLAESIRHQAAGGITGVVPCGTTGEAPTLTDQEHRVVVEKTRCSTSATRSSAAPSFRACVRPSAK